MIINLLVTYVKGIYRKNILILGQWNIATQRGIGRIIKHYVFYLSAELLIVILFSNLNVSCYELCCYLVIRARSDLSSWDGILPE